MTECRATSKEAGGLASKRGQGTGQEANAPVFELVASSKPLPGVWVTRQIERPTLETTGRERLFLYPSNAKIKHLLDYEDAVDAGMEEADGDPLGDMALDLGAAYYEEGMQTQDALFRQDRIDCFRAAEVLYLWAANKDNVWALVNLGYVYSYDRCEGFYLGCDEWGEPVAPEGEPFPRERRAYECLATAAELGHPEGCYKLGDLVAKGQGCPMDLERAVALWKHAYELSVEEDVPLWWGAASLRLGEAFEEGRGCEQDYGRALRWYERAQAGLRVEVEAGNWFYEHSLAQAEHGFARCKQELDGRY